ILLAAHTLSRIVVHLDDLGRDDQLEISATLQIRGPHDRDRNTEFDRGMSTGEDLAGRSVAAHRVNGDRQHQRGLRLSRRRQRRGLCTNRMLGTRCAAAWRRNTVGTHCATVPTASMRRHDGYATWTSTSFSWERPLESSLTKRATRG